jgi:hypothetical protein
MQVAMALLQIMTASPCGAIMYWSRRGHLLISKKHRGFNDFVGEVSDSMFAFDALCLRQLSHRRHHFNHNHLTSISQSSVVH